MRNSSAKPGSYPVYKSATIPQLFASLSFQVKVIPKLSTPIGLLITKLSATFSQLLGSLFPLLNLGFSTVSTDPITITTVLKNKAIHNKLGDE